MSIKEILTKVLVKLHSLDIHDMNLSTEHGGYLNFENGLSIQWAFDKSFGVDSALSQINSSGSYVSNGTVVLDSPIRTSLSASVMVGSTRYSTGYRVPFGYSGMNTTTNARIVVFDYYARPKDSNWKVSFILIGKWK